MLKIIFSILLVLYQIYYHWNHYEFIIFRIKYVLYGIILQLNDIFSVMHLFVYMYDETNQKTIMKYNRFPSN